MANDTVITCEKCEGNLFLLKWTFVPDGKTECGLRRCCAGCGHIVWIIKGSVIEGVIA